MFILQIKKQTFVYDLTITNTYKKVVKMSMNCFYIFKT